MYKGDFEYYLVLFKYRNKIIQLHLVTFFPWWFFLSFIDPNQSWVDGSKKKTLTQHLTN